MSTALRTPFVAGVALLGAGAIAVAPTLPVGSAHLPVRTIAVTNTAMRAQIANPFDEFQPVVVDLIRSTYAAVEGTIDDPFPIVRAVLSNQATYFFQGATGVVRAGWILGAATFDLPFAVATAVQQAADGSVDLATETLRAATIVPLQDAFNVLSDALERNLSLQRTIAKNLSTAVPQAAALVLSATQNAIVQISAAVTEAAQNMGDAVRTGQPVAIWNAAVRGAANVTLVAEQVTVGGGGREEAESAAAEADSADAAAKAAPRSIRLALTEAQATIVDAINVRAIKEKAAAAESSRVTSNSASTTKTVKKSDVSTKKAGGGSKRAAAR